MIQILILPLLIPFSLFSSFGPLLLLLSSSTYSSCHAAFQPPSRMLSSATSYRLLTRLQHVCGSIRGAGYHHSSPKRATALDATIPKLDMGPDPSKYTPYEQYVRRLYQTNIFHPVKLGLTNIQQIHDAIGGPMDNPNIPVIHIAGTNGKGSVALKIAKTLELSNPALKVGLFCSPHVSSFRERMQINGRLITEEEVVEFLPRLYDMCETNKIPATFFEITTALAFLFFRNANVVVLETGLGGRLDATNVIQAPAVSIITSIGLEHTRILGDTIQKIAREKGGIIKKDRPVLVGPHVPHDVLRAQAQEQSAEGYYTCDDVLGPSDKEISDYDQENARTAQAALVLLERFCPNLMMNLSPDVVKRGTSIRPPCRFEVIERTDGVTVVLDVAHNPPAMEYLFRKLKDTYPNCRYRIVVGMSSDKDLGLCADIMLKDVTTDSIHLVQALHPRAAKLEQILEAAPQLQHTAAYDLENRSITKQLESAIQLAKDKDEILVVCGSVFLMAEAREALGFDEPRDSIYIAEVAGAHLRHGQEIFADTDPEKTIFSG